MIACAFLVNSKTLLSCTQFQNYQQRTLRLEFVDMLCLLQAVVVGLLTHSNVVCSAALLKK